MYLSGNILLLQLSHIWSLCYKTTPERIILYQALYMILRSYVNIFRCSPIINLTIKHMLLKNYSKAINMHSFLSTKINNSLINHLKFIFTEINHTLIAVE